MSFCSPVITRILRHLRSVMILAVSLALSNIAAAEAPSAETSQIKVSVRTIQASGPRQLQPTSGEQPAGVTLDDSLNDLKAKLDLLPFSSFKLIASKEQHISLKQRDSLHLPNGQTLSFRPIYMEKERVGMWLHWKDTDGSDILNTRIHFDADESVLTGTDFEENEGRILAIRADKIH